MTITDSKITKPKPEIEVTNDNQDPFDDDLDYLIVACQDPTESTGNKDDIKIITETPKSTLQNKRPNESKSSSSDSKKARNDVGLEEAKEAAAGSSRNDTLKKSGGFVPPRSLLDTKNGSGFDLAVKILEAEDPFDPELKGIVKNEAQILYLKKAIDRFNAAIFLHKFGITK